MKTDARRDFSAGNNLSKSSQNQPIDEPDDDDNDLFVPQEDTAATALKRPHGQSDPIDEDTATSATGPVDSNPSAPKRRRRQARVTAKEDRKSIEIGLNIMLSRRRVTSGRGIADKLSQIRNSDLQSQSQAALSDDQDRMPRSSWPSFGRSWRNCEAAKMKTCSCWGCVAPCANQSRWRRMSAHACTFSAKTVF